MRPGGADPWRWMTDRRITFALKLLMVVVLACYAAQFVLGFLEQIRAVVYILIGTIFFAYLIYPAVHRLRRRMPLGVAILVTYAALVVLLLVLGWFIVPRVTEDVGTFVQQYPDLVTRVNDIIYNPNDALTSRLPVWMRDEIARIPTEVGTWVKTRGVESVGQVVLVLAGGFAAVATFVIIPLMQHDVVTTYHWMTGGQFLNAVALGQVTPGPLVQTVAVVGYAARGVGGGLLAATVAFAPSFLFVLFGAPRFDQIRRNGSVQSFLAGAGPAAVGAIAGSAVALGLTFQHLWQTPVLGGALLWLLAVRRGVVGGIVLAGLAGVALWSIGVPT